jgi:hydroxymethylpyrimidine pyrophosphatase-like HAD family hydrolase
MFFKALAFDFDGTLASDDRIGPRVREALERARKAGLRLILVTGRTFFELSRVCDCLELFEAVVAENGAVLYYPGSAMIRNQGPPPSTRLLAELDRRGISYQVGRVIVGAARGDEAPIREALAAAGVSRDSVYNRSALMLLPAGVSKGTGVLNALRFLGLSFHDVLAFGDAENDLPFFEVSGWWSSAWWPPGTRCASSIRRGTIRCSPGSLRSPGPRSTARRTWCDCSPGSSGTWALR